MKAFWKNEGKNNCGDMRFWIHVSAFSLCREIRLFRTERGEVLFSQHNYISMLFCNIFRLVPFLRK